MTLFDISTPPLLLLVGRFRGENIYFLTGVIEVYYLCALLLTPEIIQPLHIFSDLAPGHHEKCCHLAVACNSRLHGKAAGGSPASVCSSRSRSACQVAHAGAWQEL